MTTIERSIAGGMGAAAIVGASAGHQFDAGAFGLGDRTKPISKWFGRLWFIYVGLGFISLALGFAIPLLLRKIICFGVGLYAISAALLAAHPAEPLGQTILSMLKSALRRQSCLLAMLVGFFLVIGGILLK
jgi:hypothetical protein